MIVESSCNRSPEPVGLLVIVSMRYQRVKYASDPDQKFVPLVFETAIRTCCEREGYDREKEMERRKCRKGQRTGKWSKSGRIDVEIVSSG